MATEILAPGTSAGNTTDIPVLAGAPANVSLFRDDEAKIEIKCTCPIFKKDSAGNWNPTTWSLNHDSPTRVIVGAGIYQIRRPGDLAKATGIDLD